MKTILIASILIAPAISYANSKTTRNSELKENPSLATKVLVGVMVDRKDGMQELVPKFSWTTFFKPVEIVPDYDLDLQPIKTGISGEYYLLYSQSIQGDDDKILRSDPMLIHPLKNAGELMNVFSKQFNMPGKLNPSWKYCLKDNECIKTKNSCKSYSINKSYKKYFDKYLNDKSLKAKCDQTSSEAIILKCTNYMCE